ncbi:AraC family transcriptional regulator ligand-binding domain-containing protein [Albidovulum sp.]|uniref:AraC family transcriptional regulator n=1 Tax=Albidovulum sp. TaxID=1872424 RepID=UPI0039B81DC8
MDGQKTATAKTSRFCADAMQRTTSLMQLPALLAEFSVPLPRLEAACPVPSEVWTDPAFALPMSRFCEVLDAAARLAGCRHLGLLLGARVDAAMLGLPGQWLASAPTLHDAIQGFILLQPANTRAAGLYLLDQGADAFLGYSICDRWAPGREQVYALAMSITTRKIRQLTRGRHGPAEVLLPFRAPPDPEIYAHMLAAPIRFDATVCGMVLPRAALACPAGAAAGLALDDWLRRAQTLLPPSSRNWTSRTRLVLRPLLSRGRSVRADVARLAGVSPRTLNRRLEEEGSSLRDLVEDLRFVMAEELLLLTDLRMGEIGLALGFEAEGSFFRSFRRWTGTTPENWRRRHGWSGIDPDDATIPPCDSSQTRLGT